MKQTAIEWLYERLERMIPRTALYNIDKEDYFKQAKEMEKSQIKDAYETSHISMMTSEQYYNENFKTKSYGK